jgi:hypothetical protein
MMNNYNWCHGTECHTYETQDRLRGVKGKKVLRTRKIQVKDWHSPTSSWNWFCSHSCQQNFWNKYGAQIRAIAPCNEPLETPVDVIKEEKVGYSGHRFTETKIKPIQTQVRQS